jgi:hypothetical protein
MVGENAVRILTKLIKINETGEWSMDFTEFTLIALRKRSQMLPISATIAQSASSDIEQR